MKQLNFLALIFISCIMVLNYSCSDSKQGNSDEGNADSTEAPAVSPVKGTWVVRNYYLADISAMDDKMAKEWTDKKLVIGEKLYFDFAQIGFYKNEFRDQNECELTDIDSPEVDLASEHFDIRRKTFSDLKLDSAMIKIYHTSCKDHPFSEFMLTDKNELIFSWDGAFFVLTKEENI